MVGGVACGSSQRARGHAKLTAKEIVQKASPAIVRVEADDDKVGTGFIVDGTAGKGLIATNLHVVAGATRIRIHTFDGKDYQVARIGGLDPDRDLALLEINDNPALPTLTIGDSDVLTAGDPITAIGNPLGVLDYSVSNGLISSVRVLSPELKLLQISAPISQGSSGGRRAPANSIMKSQCDPRR